MMFPFICIILFWAIGTDSKAHTRKSYKVTIFNSTLPLADTLANITLPLVETLVNVTRVYKKRFHPTNASSPSITNTTTVSAPMTRLANASMEPVLKVPQLEKTKTWVPTCPSTMPTICPQLTNVTASVKKTFQFPTIVVSSAPPPQKIQKYCNRPHLRGGTHPSNNDNPEKKNLRGSF
jgi:hypothetical protein